MQMHQPRYGGGVWASLGAAALRLVTLTMQRLCSLVAAAGARGALSGGRWCRRWSSRADTPDDVPAAPRRGLYTNALTGTIPPQLSTMASLSYL